MLTGNALPVYTRDMHTAATKKASQLEELDVLADGAVVLATSHQLNWFYVKAIHLDPPKLVRRRYRHDQQVSVREDNA